MSELHEYHQNLMADIRRDADASGIFPVEALFDLMTERLTEAGELEFADRCYHQSGDGGQRLRIDGYAGDPRNSEGILGLIVCDFVDNDEVQTFGKGDVPPILNPLIRFLKKARTEDFRDALNEVSPAFQVSDLIITTWSQVKKVKLILISNRQYIGRDDTVRLTELGDVPITWSVWDLARFERFDVKGTDEIEIDLAGEFGGAVPALMASRRGAALESYLMIIPGAQLAQIYDRWGEKLLQGNVRSFLQARAKTNKGIQTTIRSEPELFFPYNNGLSATADAVTCVEGPNGLEVVSISNLQIVNGAQTTGSLHALIKTAAEQLQQIFVQMKLTVVPPDRSEDIVPRISEFANTQNKVNAADFFANHPFHIRMQEFSRDVIFARREGVRHDTKWFYERARGQYLNARPKVRGRAQTDFDILFPKAQLFSKTDLAKFEYSAAGFPHTVSKGAQKNFSEFAKEIGEAWSRSDAKFDELWYRRLIAKAVIFRKLETEVPRQPWYEGGYRANIVTYSMAKVFHDANYGKQILDLDTIWRRQAVTESLQRVLMIAAAEANDVITHPPEGVRNMSEWAKQQACWNILKGRNLDYGDDFDSCLVLHETARTNARDQRKAKRQEDGISAQTDVVNRGPEFWQDVLTRGVADRKLTPKDQQILQVCASMPRQIPSELQSRHAIRVLERMKEQGLVAE